MTAICLPLSVLTIWLHHPMKALTRRVKLVSDAARFDPQVLALQTLYRKRHSPIVAELARAVETRCGNGTGRAEGTF